MNPDPTRSGSGRPDELGGAPVQDCEARATRRCGDIEVDCAHRRATVAGSSLALTDQEFDLLVHFVDRANRMLTRSELLASVWNAPYHGGSNLVDVFVYRLRRRLGAHARMIETVRGLGYRFRAPDEAEPAAPG
jgi:DNA-binding response OmpR family regulator